VAENAQLGSKLPLTNPFFSIDMLATCIFPSSSFSLVPEEFHSHEGKSRGWDVPCYPGDASSKQSLDPFHHPNPANSIQPAIVPASSQQH